MDEKALKKVIKQLVRESLTEIFAEMKLETIVEGVVSKKVAPKVSPATTPRFSMKDAMGVQEEASVRAAPQQVDASTRRKKIMESLGGNDMWKDIYADTAASDNPILEGDESPADREQVPSSVLESMGLMKDYSKHIGMDDKKVQEDSEWQKRREERAKILAKVKRA